MQCAVPTILVKDAFSKDWGRDQLWVNAPFSRMQDVVLKAIIDQAQERIIDPVWKAHDWLWELGEKALDWWDLPADQPVYQDNAGFVLPPSRGWTTRVGLFDAFSSNVGDSACDEVAGGYEGDTDTAPRLRDLVEHDAKGEYYRPRSQLSVRAAVQADQEDLSCAEIRAQIQESFKETFFKHIPIKDVPRDLRPHGEHAIPFKTGTPQPQKCVPYRRCGIQDAAFRELVNKVIAEGFLQKADSVWGARAFVVPKPGGKWRRVIDYRHLNSQVSDDPFPFPVIEDMILSQGKNALWSDFDLEDGFHHMHLAPESRQYTAFVTPRGVYEWLVLPMGLRTAPTAYHRMVAACLDTGFGEQKGFTKHFGAKPYIDDLLHGTPDGDNLERSEKLIRLCIENRERQLRELFNILAHYKLSLKPEECKMLVNRVKFCGHILTPGGRHRDPEKVAAIERWRWEDITTPTHLKRFLGFTQWYSVYIHDYARMAAPLQMALQGMCLTKAQRKAQKYQRQTDLLPGTGTCKRGNFSKMSQEEMVHHSKLQGKIYWNPKMKEAFEELEQRFQKEVILQFPDLSKDW